MRLFIILAAAFVIAASTHAAVVDTPEGVTPDPWLALIPVLTTMFIALLKKILPKIPSYYLPWVAPLIGAAADIIMFYSAGVGAGNGLVGGILGSAGVGLREIYDQGKKAATDTINLPSLPS
jgi:MFS superfamily sulfate permease-like transporter